MTDADDDVPTPEELVASGKRLLRRLNSNIRSGIGLITFNVIAASTSLLLTPPPFAYFGFINVALGVYAYHTVKATWVMRRECIERQRHFEQWVKDGQPLP